MVAAYLLAAARFDELALAGEVFNIGTGIATSVLDLVASIDGACRTAGVGALNTRVLGSARHEIPFQLLDASKAHARLGWTSMTTLDEGLARTLPWYRQVVG